MGLISSILHLGTFEVPLSDLRNGGDPLSVEEADGILSREHSLLERIYLWYITSFTHHHEFGETECSGDSVLRIAPTKWLKKFLFAGLGFVFALAILIILFGEQDRESARILTRAIITFPIVTFGIPFFLGWLYFKYCVRRLREHSTDAQ